MSREQLSRVALATHVSATFVVLGAVLFGAILDHTLARTFGADGMLARLLLETPLGWLAGIALLVELVSGVTAAALVPRRVSSRLLRINAALLVVGWLAVLVALRLVLAAVADGDPAPALLVELLTWTRVLVWLARGGLLGWLVARLAEDREAHAREVQT